VTDRSTVFIRRVGQVFRPSPRAAGQCKALLYYRPTLLAIPVVGLEHLYNRRIGTQVQDPGSYEALLARGFMAKKSYEQTKVTAAQQQSHGCISAGL